jgi:hypothetical protein
MAKSCPRYSSFLFLPPRAYFVDAPLCHMSMTNSSAKYFDLTQEKVLATLSEWLSDPATSANVTILLVAGLIYTNEENYVEALRAVHGGHNLEMCVPVAGSEMSAYASPVLAGCCSCKRFVFCCALAWF